MNDKQRTIWIPAGFWNDHWSRCPYDDPKDMPTEVVQAGQKVLIRATEVGLRGLMADARYYADADNMDECPRYLRESAKRTVAALAKAGA